MSTLILHTYRRCPFAIRVRMTLEEKNLKYQKVEEDLSNPSETLKKLHPEVKVPLLIDEGMPIYESAVITEYLDEKFGEPKLMPSALLGKTQVRLWTAWNDHVLKPDLDLFKYDYKEMTQEDREKLQSRLEGHLGRLTGALRKSNYLMGEALTLADIHLFPFYRQLQKSHPDFRSMFKTEILDQWLNRMIERPSFERVMAKI